MYNMNSPIINNMMNMGVYQAPPNPIGNIVNMGMGYNTGTNYNMNYNCNPNNGYNNYNMGGYYNNMYSNYYNPYLVAKQQEIRQAQMQEQQTRQVNMMKMIATRVNTALGLDTTEESLKKYEPVEMRQDQEEADTYRLLNLNRTAFYGNPRLIARIINNNKKYDEAKKEFPDNMTMFEYHQKAGKLYRDAVFEKYREKQKDISKLYNSEDYSKLIRSKGGSSYRNRIFGGNGETNIDDMEICLPSDITKEYQERRQAFLDSIFNKG